MFFKPKALGNATRPQMPSIRLDRAESSADFLFRLEQKIDPYLSQPDTLANLTGLVVELNEIREIDCIGLGKLLHLQKAFQNQGKTLYFSGMGTTSREALERSGLQKVFNLL